MNLETEIPSSRLVVFFQHVKSMMPKFIFSCLWEDHALERLEMFFLNLAFTNFLHWTQDRCQAYPIEKRKQNCTLPRKMFFSRLMFLKKPHPTWERTYEEPCSAWHEGDNLEKLVECIAEKNKGGQEKVTRHRTTLYQTKSYSFPSKRDNFLVRRFRSFVCVAAETHIELCDHGGMRFALSTVRRMSLSVSISECRKA